MDIWLHACPARSALLLLRVRCPAGRSPCPGPACGSPASSTQEQVGANGGADRSPPRHARTSGRQDKPIAGRLPAGLLGDVRIHFQPRIFNTCHIFPSSSGSRIIAKETGAANSAFVFLYWMKQELKMGRGKQGRNPAWEMRRLQMALTREGHTAGTET